MTRVSAMNPAAPAQRLAVLTAEEMLFEAFSEYERLLRTSDLIGDLLAAAESLLDRQPYSSAERERVLIECRTRAWRRFIGSGRNEEAA